MMYNPYYNNSQVSIERIDGQIRELENMRNQVQQRQQPAINQTFQLSPGTMGGIRFADSKEDVDKELVFSDSVFLNKDFTNMWIKNTKGEVKSYKMIEIVQKDEKDLIIDELRARIDKLERGERDERPEYDEPTTSSVQE